MSIVAVVMAAVAILVMCSCRRVGAEPIPPPMVDYIFEMADGVYADIPENDCLVQQMCVREGEDGDEVRCYEFYVFPGGSLAMMPWEGE